MHVRVVMCMRPNRIWRKTYDAKHITAERMTDLAQNVIIRRKAFLKQKVFGRCSGPDVGQRK